MATVIKILHFTIITAKARAWQAIAAYNPSYCLIVVPTGGLTWLRLGSTQI